LERPFEDDEVFEVVKALNGDKVPDPDGLILMILVWTLSVLGWTWPKINVD